jgi:catechol 2,3-dioxygenase-like lactoylglutathione lyase family enzyme
MSGVRDTGEMGFHHVALATHDAAATHEFYTEVMGFELVKVHVGPTPNTTGAADHAGFSKHFFYATNTDVEDRDDADRDLIAFWEIQDDAIGEYQVNINAASGLPGWVNHIAFDAPSRAALDRHRTRWQQHGHRVIEIDHGFCSSIYLGDPSGNMVEFCLTTRSFTDAERTDALAKLQATKPEFDADPTIIVHDALTPA